MPTFEKAGAVCFAEKRETWRSGSPAHNWRSAMDRYVLPKIGAMAVDKVGGAAVYEVLRPIALAGEHATVKGAAAAITAVLDWTRIAEFHAEGSPVETVRRRLPKRADSRPPPRRCISRRSAARWQGSTRRSTSRRSRGPVRQV